MGEKKNNDKNWIYSDSLSSSSSLAIDINKSPVGLDLIKPSPSIFSIIHCVSILSSSSDSSFFLEYHQKPHCYQRLISTPVHTKDHFVHHVSSSESLYHKRYSSLLSDMSSFLSIFSTNCYEVCNALFSKCYMLIKVKEKDH